MSGDSRIAYQGSRFSVSVVERKNPDGVTRQCEVIRHPGSVALLPLLDDGRICLIRNHRVTVDETLIEVPAGTREPNEAPMATAHRELIEETGYTAGKLTQLASFFPAPGLLDEEMFIFVAENLSAGDAQREPYEEIENLIVPMEEALQMINDGRIKDAKTIISLLLYSASK